MGQHTSLTDEELQRIVDADCDASWIAEALLANRQEKKVAAD